MSKKKPESILKRPKKVIARTFGPGVRKAHARDSSKSDPDPFSNDYKGVDDIIEPPYDPYNLADLLEISNVLPQLIDAMEVNCEGFGHDLIVTVPVDDRDRLKTEIEKEKKRVDSFFKNLNYNKSFTELRMKNRGDYELLGYSFFEALRNNAGDLDGIEYIKGCTMRLGRLSEMIDVEMLRLDPETYNYETITVHKRFRTFIQKIDDTNKIYFKEFGDPRIMDSKTGRILGDDDFDENKKIKEQGINPATEIIYRSQESGYSSYGVPRWIGNTTSIAGSRDSEEVNYNHFHDKTIPPYIIGVTGGTLSEGSAERIEDHFKNLKGKDRYDDILVLEIEGDSSNPNLLEKSNVKLLIKPLNQVNEGRFIEYDKENRKKVRSSFRLPDLYIGENDENTFASVVTMKQVAEEQVFGPEKRLFDDMVNRLIMPRLDVKYHTFKTKAAPIENTKEQAQVLELLSKVGLTYGEARMIIEQLTNIEMGEIAEELKDLPINLAPTLLQIELLEAQNSGSEKQKTALEFLLGIREKLQNEIKKTEIPATSGKDSKQ